MSALRPGRQFIASLHPFSHLLWGRIAGGFDLNNGRCLPSLHEGHRKRFSELLNGILEICSTPSNHVDLLHCDKAPPILRAVLFRLHFKYSAKHLNTTRRHVDRFGTVRSGQCSSDTGETYLCSELLVAIQKIGHSQMVHCCDQGVMGPPQQELLFLWRIDWIFISNIVGSSSEEDQMLNNLP